MAEIVKRNPGSEKERIFLDGSKRSIALLNSIAIGRGTYLPGWKWSKHAGPQTGKRSAAHIGYILSGRMAIKGADGKEVEVGPGDCFEVKTGHDAWVLGDVTCVALDFQYRKS